MALSGADPVLVRVRGRWAEAPTVMLPKLRAAGESRSCDWMPVPVRGTVRGWAEAEEVSDRVPLSGPAAAGENRTLMEQTPPAARVTPAAGQVPEVV